MTTLRTLTTPAILRKATRVLAEADPAMARLIAQGKTMSDLITPSVPNRVVLDAPVVTEENVDEYYDLAFAS